MLKQSWQNSTIFNWKEKRVIASKPLLLSNCVAINQLHLTQLLFLNFFPPIIQRKLRASPLTSKSWLTLEQRSPAVKTRFPFSTGYTTYFFPNTQYPLILQVAAQYSLLGQIWSFCQTIETATQRVEFGLVYFVLSRTKYVEVVFSIWLPNRFHLFCFQRDAL